MHRKIVLCILFWASFVLIYYNINFIFINKL